MLGAVWVVETGSGDAVAALKDSLNTYKRV